MRFLSTLFFGSSKTPIPKITIGTHGFLNLFKTRIPLSTLDTHHYIVGMTGKGKSSYMLSLAHQLITQEQGVAVVDPHGDLVSDLLMLLDSYPQKSPWLSSPENRKRIIYLDARSDYVVPFNPLAAIHAEPFVIAQSVIEAFRRTWPTLDAAPRFADIARHSLLTLIENRLSLIELPRLLTDKPYREELLANVQNPKLIHFFHDRFDRWGRDTPLMIESLLNKTTALTLNPFLEPMLSAPTCLNLRAVMDEGKVLLINLRTPDEETRTLLGSLIMTMFEQQALSRESLPKEKRRKFFLMVDEFQKFTANEGSVVTLAEILSEARKYALHMIFAHQSWGQLSSYQRLSGALEQAQVKAIFGTGRQTAQALASSIYLPDPDLVKHTVDDPEQQLRTHPLYEQVSTQIERATGNIMRLKKRRILVQLPDCETPILLNTPTIPPLRVSRARLSHLKSLLARQHGIPRQNRTHEYKAPAKSAIPVHNSKPAPGNFWNEEGENILSVP